MALSDVLDTIGQGVKKGAQVAGTVIGDVADPEAAQQRQADKNAQEDQVINAKAGLLQNQLEAGRKYGTITPEQEQDLSNQIIGLYNQPRHAPMLMERLRQIIHPNGAVAQGPMSENLGLPAGISAYPKGGTVAYEAQQKALSRPERAPNAKYQALDTYTKQNFNGTAFADATAEQQEAALEHFQTATTKQIGTKIVQDKTSPTGYSYGTYNLVHGGDAISLIPGAPAPRTGTEYDVASKSTDQFGNVTTTIRKTTPHPIGVNPGEIPTTPPGAAPAPVLQPTLQPTPLQPVETTKTAAKKPAPKSAAAIQARMATPASNVATALSSSPTGTPGLAPMAPGATKQLTDDYKIPAADLAGVNPQVAQIANDLLNGVDPKDVKNSKAIPMAEKLAGEYGYQRGKFTPREQNQIRLAATFILAGANDPALKAVDQNLFKRIQTSVSNKDAEKAGWFGTAAITAAAASRDPLQDSYLQWYNRAVGLVQSMGSLLRGRNMITEQGVERLIRELPNPANVHNSADAKRRLQLIGEEIQRGLDKGFFSDKDMTDLRSKIETGAPPPAGLQSAGGYSPGDVVVMKDGSRRRITGPKGDNGKYPSELVK